MDKFNENLKLLLEQITNVFPEQREHIESIYNFEEPGDKYLSSFYLNCRTMGDDVSSKNEIIFSKENTILDGVNFYEIWNSEKINPDMKKNIWKYLHTLYVYAYEYEKDQDLKTIMKELKKMGGNRDEMDEDTRTLANIIDSLTGKFDKAPEGMEEDTPSGGDEPFSNFAPPELFDGMIGDLAKEIADEINPEELNLDDPSQLLKDLMSGNFDMENDSSGIGNLVKNITGKIQSKLANGNLDESALFAEAQNVMQNFGKGGDSKKGFGGQMGKMFETMMKGGMGGAGGQGGMPDMAAMMAGMGGAGGQGGMPDMAAMMAGMGGNGDMGGDQMNILKNAQNIVNNGGGGNARALKTEYDKKATKDRLRAKLETKRLELDNKEKELVEKAKMQADYDDNVDLDALAAEIEAIGSDKSDKSNNSKKSKKSKKKKH